MNRNNFYKYLNNLERHTKSNHNGWNNDDATAKYEMFWSGVQGSMHLSSPKLHNDYSNDNYLYKKGNLLNPKQAYLFYADGIIKLMWDIIISFLIVITILLIPYEVFFVDTVTYGVQTFHFVVDAMFVADVGATFNTAIVDMDHADGRYITNRSIIAAKYLKFWFWVDIVSSIPLDVIVESIVDHRYNTAALFQAIRILRLAKLARLFKLKRLISNFEFLSSNSSLVSFAVLLTQIVFFAHITACLWYSLATNNAMNQYATATTIDQRATVSGSNTTLTWLSAIGMQDSPHGDQYVASIYWTFTTMLAVGYGDIVPVTLSERIFTILCMLSGGILFGFVISQMVRILEMRNPHKRTIKLRKEELKAYLNERSVPAKLHKQAEEAYSYFLPRKSPFVEPDNTMKELPDKLRYELAESMFQKELESINLSHLDPVFTLKLVMNGKPWQAKRGQVIYDAGDVSDELVFVIEGMVCISTSVDNKQEIILGYSTAGGFCGDLEFTSRRTRIARYTTTTKCKFISISYRFLSELFVEQPDAGSTFKVELNERLKLFRQIQKSQLQPFVRPRKEDRPYTFALTFQDSSSAKSVCTSDKNQELSTSDKTKLPIPCLNVSDKFMKSTKVLFQAWTVRHHPLLSHAQMWMDGELKKAEEVIATVDIESIHFKGQGVSDEHYHVLRLESTIHADSVMVKRKSKSVKTVKLNKSIVHTGIIQSSSDNIVMTEEKISDTGKSGLLHPKGFWKQSWDLSIAMAIVASALYIPVQICFGVDSITWIIANLIFDMCFLVDMIFSSRTAYYDEENDAYVAIPKMIIVNYVSGWFLVDLCSCLPFDALLLIANKSTVDPSLAPVNLVKTIRLLRAIKLIRTLKLSDYTNHIEERLKLSPIMFDLIKTVFKVMFISHGVACLWWGLSSIVHPSWYDHLQVGDIPLAKSTTAQQYLTSLYAVTATLTTTGYGDIVSTDSAERIVDVLIMLLGASVFGYIIANVSTLVGNLNMSHLQSVEKQTEVQKFLLSRDIPSQLSSTIIRHFKHSMLRKSLFNEKLILNDLPCRLSNAIVLATNLDIMKQIKIFRYIENEMVALHIFKQMVPIYVDAGKVVIRQGELPSEMIFLVSGVANVYRMEHLSPTQHGERSHKGNYLRRTSSTMAMLLPIKLDRSTKQVVTDGKDQTSNFSENLRKVALNKMVPGEFAGLSALLRHSEHAANVETQTTCNFYVLRCQDILELIHEQPSIALTLQAALGKAARDQHNNLSKQITRHNRMQFLSNLKQKHIRLKKSRSTSIKNAILRNSQSANALTLSVGTRTEVESSDTNSSPGYGKVRKKSAVSFASFNSASNKKTETLIFDSQEFTDIDDGMSLPCLNDSEGQNFDLEYSNRSKTALSSESDIKIFTRKLKPRSLTVGIRNIIFTTHRKIFLSDSALAGGSHREIKTPRRRQIDKILNQSTMMYDSEDDENDYFCLDAKKNKLFEKNRSSKAKRFSITTDGIRKSLSRKLSVKKLTTVSLSTSGMRKRCKAGTSLSDKCTINVSGDSLTLFQAKKNETHFNGNETLVKPNQSHPVGRLCRQDSMITIHKQELRAAPHAAIIRRQSFPSLDNESWHRDIEKQIFI